MKRTCLLVCGILFCLSSLHAQVSKEKNGYVEVEAERFFEQTNSSDRTWHVMSKTAVRHDLDGDSLEYLSASRGAFVELLPDTRVTHDDPLIAGVNFSNEPGISILKYKVKFTNPGKYYVWGRAFSTGKEDNGIHVGINGEWPESGQRMQWCAGKNQWTWASKQRTKEAHCGEEGLIYLNIDKPGMHTIQFSMREDGFAFDKFALNAKYEQPRD
ncbi:hypothetical protein N7E81_17115 [Reichenbachiella carrageenanivorans]|uniref:Gylcosyl hydrolase 115 C-terminal domain-containing protein n=1 Tax=Reichenbachiella carrageenanivorans TaxID=2979869 RepID=A0ABY6CYT3_9BACT|nr:hypothetical protein [Reichenbachiella carrageenanivorans]UXX79077.1 hypothetical protein N7E81_17115 [Reichenbachiella carrageenanivorans]